MQKKIINQFVANFENNVSLHIKRDDLLHPFVSGNKIRKLKYNLIEAKAQNHQTILTFGGAFSNHIAAVAYAGFENNIKTIGIIRGEELKNKSSSNATLSFAKAHGMRLEFVSREEYRKKNDVDFLLNLEKKHGFCYILPEGGTNDLAIKGCQEILTIDDQIFDYICCTVGTSGTIVGLINSASENQKIIAFPALKGDFILKDIENKTQKKNWSVESNYHFGGYAKVSDALITFINIFKVTYQIPLDPVYTGKMMFGIFDMIQKKQFPANSKILAIHTGGLQGIEGMNQYLKKNNRPLIERDILEQNKF